MTAPRTTLMLPNEKLVDMTGVTSVSVVMQSSPDDPCVEVTTRDAAGEEQVERNPCDTDEQAAEARNVILAAVRAFFRDVAIANSGNQGEETGEERNSG